MTRDKQSGQGENSDQVQDYLDMLLMSATEQPEAMVDLALPSESSLKTKPVTGTAQLAVVKKAYSQHKPCQPRPFAEPKPLTLSMPLTKIAAQEVITDKLTIDTSIAESVLTEHALNDQLVAPEIKTELQAQFKPLPDQTMAPESDRSSRSITSVWMSNGRPEWAQERFECLLFKVGGLSLAVPLVELGTIYPLSEKLTPLFGQADWFMGLLSAKQLNIRTVDTAKLVMPERYCEKMRDRFSYVLSINGVDWGLAVDSVANAVTLDPNAVKWRTGRSKRPWLAGTVVEHMCALLDISQLAAIFLENDKHQ